MPAPGEIKQWTSLEPEYQDYLKKHQIIKSRKKTWAQAWDDAGTRKRDSWLRSFKNFQKNQKIIGNRKTLDLVEYHALRSKHLNLTNPEFVKFLNGDNPDKITYITDAKKVPFTEETIKDYQRPSRLKGYKDAQGKPLKPLKFESLNAPWTITEALEQIKKTNPALVKWYNKSKKTDADKRTVTKAAYGRYWLEQKREADPTFRKTEEYRAKKRAWSHSSTQRETRRLTNARNLALKQQRMGAFPTGKNAKENLWYDIFASTKHKQGLDNPDSRFKVVAKTLPRRVKGKIPWRKDNSQQVKFYDTISKETFGYDDLEKFINKNKKTIFPKNYKFKKTPYDRALLPYLQKQVLNSLALQKEGIPKGFTSSLNELLIKGWSPTNRVQSIWNVHHPAGIADNPIFSHLADYDRNMGEWRARVKLTENLAGLQNQSQINKVMSTWEKGLAPGILSMHGGRTYGTELPAGKLVTEMATKAGLDKDLETLVKPVGVQRFLEKLVNQQSQKEFGRDVCKDGCFIKTTKENPGLVKRALSKLPKGGRLGAIGAAIAGAGAVGLGAGALFGGSEAKAEEVVQEPGTTELEAQDITIDQPASMAYNATEGNFVNAEGEKETQPGVLNWIADNPTKSSLAALPLMMGAGFGLDTASKFGDESVARRGLGRAGRYLTGWRALIPAMMIPHALHEYKAGYDLPEMVTNPINALWALGIRGKKDMAEVAKYYEQMKAAGRKGLDMTTLKGLKSVEGWKRLPKDFQTAMMSPAAKGTNLAFGETFRKPFVKTMQALHPEFDPTGIAKTKGAQSFGKRALLRAALIPAGILAATPAGWLTAGFLGADFLWDQYKDYRDGNIRIDEMRARGSISEDEADNYRSLILQGSIPFGLGNRMFGPDTMRIGGEDLDPTQQRELLKGMEAQLDEWQAGDMERRSKYREDHFEDGGRVGFKTGGMDRRTFLKWLVALATGATGIFRGKSKDVVKPLVADATKAVPAKFIGVEGMPAWFPRAVAKIKTHGKLIEMADKHYVQGDIYEMVIPVKVPKFDMVGGKQKMSGFETVNKKVTLEDNPLSGEIELRWSVDDFDGDMIRQINFRPGEAGYQKFGVDDAEGAAQGATEFQRVKVTDPEFSYGNPDQGNPYRDDFEFKDIFTEGDEVVKGLEDLTKTKQMVAKEGSVIEVSAEGKGVDEAFQKKIYKDIEGEGQIIPEPEGAGVTQQGDVYGEEQYNEIIGGIIPDHLKKKASGGSIETGNIAREPGLVPPLSGPTPQGKGIVGLFSNPKQVSMRS